MSPPYPWSAVLFDLDGTLADTVPLIVASYRHTMEVHRGEVPADETWLRHMGRPLRDTVRDLVPDDREAEAVIRTYVEFQRGAHDDMVAAFPGAREVVDRLRASGVPLALVTSKAREMALRTLSVCGLSDTFPVVITADEVERGKPHPEPVLTALEELGVPGGDDVLFVGDSPHDVEAGRSAGVRTVGVTWGGAFDEARLLEADPHHLISAFPDLLELRR